MDEEFNDPVARVRAIAAEKNRIGGCIGGWFGRLLGKLSAARQHAPHRLAVIERIALAPRHSLALVEAEGRRFLIVISPEGAPAFQALDPSGIVAAGDAVPRSETAAAHSIAPAARTAAARAPRRIRDRAARVPW